MSKYTYSQECFRLFYIIKVFVVTSYFVEVEVFYHVEIHPVP